MGRATITDVADLAGVSVATVSRALRSLPNVSDVTRAKVEQAASDLNYRIDAGASSLASGRTNLIGLAAPLFSSRYTAEVVNGVESTLSSLGYDLLVFSLDPEDRHSLFRNRLPARKIDGLLLVDFFVADEALADIDRLNTPVVALGEAIDGHSSFCIDNAQGGEMAVQHLVELGHTNIAYVGDRLLKDYPSPVTQGRYEGAQRAAVAAGLNPNLPNIPGGFTMSGGRHAFEQLLQLEQRPTAVFCASDEMAVGVISGALGHGLSVPHDLSVVGFDNHDMAEAVGLTTIGQPMGSAGAAAAELLLELINDSHAKPQHVLLPLTFFARGTTAPPRH